MCKLASILAAASALLLLSGFIPGPARNIFVNASSGEVRVRYKSTIITVDKPVAIRRGSGLQLTGENCRTGVSPHY